MRIEFEKELKQLHEDILKMGTAIEYTIDMMMSAMKTRDRKTLETVIKRDDIVDELECSIEKKCLHLILRQQPIVATDLRVIASILKIITDMERIADQSSDIAKYLLKIGDTISKNQYLCKDILSMAQQVKKMVVSTIECFISLNTEQAIHISLEDSIVDEMFLKMTKQLTQLMKENSNFVEEGICYLYIIKYLERIADHATNICEWIAYQVTGVHEQYN